MSEMAYIARCRECDGLVMATIDKPTRAKANARAVAFCIRDGFIVERIAADLVRALSWCFADDKHTQQKQVQIVDFAYSIPAASVQEDDEYSKYEVWEENR